MRLFFSILMLLAAALALSAVRGSAGAYEVQLVTEPAVIPVNEAQLNLTITDRQGNPVQGASVQTLTQMPGMFMGEKKVTARSGDEPGQYVSEGAFPMAGPYEIVVEISGPQGAATVSLEVSTGMNTASAETPWYLAILPWLAGAAVLVFVFYRMRVTGQQVAWKGILNMSTLGGLLLLGVILWISIYAVNNWRRKGAMTPIEGQAMEMNTPAPPGVTPVEIEPVTVGMVQESVRYTGQAVAYQEQSVYPRVQGVIEWMPLYEGDRVSKGQLIARLDTSRIEPMVQEKSAALQEAREAVAVAQAELIQAQAGVTEAEAGVNIRRNMVEEAEAMLEAARQERTTAEAELTAAETEVESARAMLSAAQADADYWAAEIKRMKALLDRGAISRSEYEKDLSESQMAQARLRQAQSAVNQAQADVNAARSAVKSASAMISAAQKRVQQAKSEVTAQQAAVRSARAMVESARRAIGQAQAQVRAAQAGVSGATTERGYTAIRAETEGVVTERLISPGVLVNPGQAILKIAQIKPIRLQANVPESDLARIKVGTTVTVREREGGEAVQARVTSVRPAVDPTSRTGVVEAVVANPDERFFPGEYVEMDFSMGRMANALRVPSSAIDRRAVPAGDIVTTEGAAYVWIAEPSSEAGQFSARRIEVTTGISGGEYTEVLSGLEEGQMVIVTGQDFLNNGETVVAASDIEVTTISVTDKGYQPSTVSVKAGEPVKLTFIRRTESSCAEDVVFLDYDIRKHLPLNQPVTIEFTPKQKGEITFTCGMDMLRGKVVAK